MQRVCVHANTHGIARSASSSPAPAASGRDAGREPISSSVSSSSGVKRPQEARQLRVVPDDRPVERAAPPRRRPRSSRARRPAPRATRSGTRGEERRRDGGLEVPPREPGEAVLERDRLPLLGHLQPTVDRVRRLGEDRGVRRPAAAPGAPAAAVEDRQLDAALSREPRERAPARGRSPTGPSRRRRPCPSRSSRPSPRAHRGGSGRGARRRASRRRAGRRSSRAAARRSRRARLARRATPRGGRRPPSASSRRSACRSPPPRAGAGARPPPRARRARRPARRAAAARGARRSSAGPVRPKTSRRRRSAARPPSAIRAPPCARRLASTRSSSRRSSVADRYPSSPSRSQIAVSRRRYGSVGLRSAGEVDRGHAASDSTSVLDMPHDAASARTSRRSSSRTSADPRSTASRTVSAPAFGLPSRSPPIQVPKRSGVPGRRSRQAARRSAAASQRLSSRNQSACRISSTTRGRDERTSSVCQRIVISSPRATSRSTRSPGVSRASSSSSRSCAIRRCFSRIVRGSASVGCAVSTSSTETLRAASASSSRATPSRSSSASASASDSRGRSPLALVLAPATHAVVLLGDVRQVEVDGEGAQDDRLRIDVERARSPPRAPAPRPCRRAGRAGRAGGSAPRAGRRPRPPAR